MSPHVSTCTCAHQSTNLHTWYVPLPLCSVQLNRQAASSDVSVHACHYARPLKHKPPLCSPTRTQLQVTMQLHPFGCFLGMQHTCHSMGSTGSTAKPHSLALTTRCLACRYVRVNNATVQANHTPLCMQPALRGASLRQSQQQPHTTQEPIAALAGRLPAGATQPAAAGFSC
jgi:hypothetical protein